MTDQKSSRHPDEPIEGFGDDREQEKHIEEIHSAILSREREEPEEGLEPTPWWVWAVGVALLFFGGFYLGRYGGSFRPVAHELEQRVAVATVGAVEAEEVRGDLVYANLCQVCHQADGKGVSRRYPPLVGSEWVVADPETPARIVLFGLQGPITVEGQTYNNKMPPQGDKLSDQEVAAVLTYIRSSWGNNAPAVSADLVKELREKHAGRGPWRAEELMQAREAE
jgi:mono/diheme cytochrome c family protein